LYSPLYEEPHYVIFPIFLATSSLLLSNIHLGILFLNTWFRRREICGSDGGEDSSRNLHLEDGGSKVLRNVGILPRHNPEDLDLKMVHVIALRLTKTVISFCCYNVKLNGISKCEVKVKVKLSLFLAKYLAIMYPLLN